MSFLFGKKKGGAAHGPGREGTISPTGPTPSSSVNNSLNSLSNHSPTSAATPDVRQVRSPSNPQPVQRAHQPTLSVDKPPGPQSKPTGPPKPGPGGQPNVAANASLYPWSQRRLTLAAQHPSPFPRYGHAANGIASKEGDVYIMGGLIRSQTVRGDLWMVEGGGDRLDAYPVVTTSEGPGPRVGHASLLVGNAFIVFGGDTKLDERDTLDETLYLLNTSTRQWSRASPHGHRPAGRYGHTLNILGSKLYIFGGQVDTLFFNDLVAFDLNTLQHVGSKWETLVAATEVSGAVPTSRTNHTIITWNDKLYLFGGTNGVDWFNDVWAYDPRTNLWSQLDCIGFIPQAREGHAAALVGDVMYIFGGRSSEGNDLGDLAAFRISSRRWYTFQNMGPSPSPRSGHSMTSVGSKILVLGGEPSIPARSQDELQLVYVLDTSKIRYPNDNPTPSGTSPVNKNNPQPGEANRRPPPQAARPMETAAPPDAPRGPGKRRDSIVGTSPTGSNPLSPNNTSGGSSRLPRASISTAPAGPPPTQQAPPPRTNGAAPGPGPRSKTPTGPQPRNKENVSPVAPRENPAVNAAVGAAAGAAAGMAGAAAVNGRRTPQMQRKDSKDPPPERTRSRQASIAGEISGGHSPVHETRDHSLETIQEPILQQSSLQQSAPPAARALPPQLQTQAPPANASRKSPSPDSRNAPNRSPIPSPARVDTATSPVGSDELFDSHEVERLKSENEWYASELSLARRAGYTPQSNASAILDERGSDMPEDERPFIEAMLALKGELSRVQGQIESDSSMAARRIQEIGRQRDVAISEAVYAKAKLAALGGSAQDNKSGDTAAMDIEKMTDMSRKLAASLSAQAEMSVRVEALAQEIAAEKKARHLADETAASAQSRISELDEYRNRTASEIESLRAELLDAGKAFRDESTLGAEASAEVKLLRIDQAELNSQLQDTVEENQNLRGSLEQLHVVMQSTTRKNTTLERQLEEERVVKEGLERKLAQVKSEYEEKTAEMENLHSRLRDMEELMESHAEEATAASAALAAGLQRVVDRGATNTPDASGEERVRALQEQVETTKALLQKCKNQADETGEKLAEAMQRVAGLEYQQGQASKDAIALRRRMAEAMDEANRLKQENAEVTARLNDKQLEVDAVATKHTALKEILAERSAQGLDKRLSRNLQSPSTESGTATPEQLNRLRELEQKLEESMRSHRETKSTAEMQAQDMEKHFREKLEQLETDYQSAVHYVKGTEKMLKRMKDELAKFKAQNARLHLELEESNRRASQVDNRLEAEEDWAAERDLLNREIDDLRSKVRESATALDKQIRETKSQLDSLREERDDFKIQYSQVQVQLMDVSQQVSQNKATIEKLEGENAMLEDRAHSAEQKVSMLLDQVESSVDQYRRSIPNGDPTGSARSSFYGAPGGPGGNVVDNRTSVALDSLATELDALRSHWESTNKNYRLSNAFDFEKPMPTPTTTGDMPSNIAQWRQKLQLDEEEQERRSRSRSIGEEDEDDDDDDDHDHLHLEPHARSPVKQQRQEFPPGQNGARSEPAAGVI